jgi:hypothetical protein
LHRNCLLKHIIEGKISWTRSQGRRCKQLLDDLKEARRYWKLKEEAQDHTLWWTEFRRGYGHVARQTTTWLWIWRQYVPLKRWFTEELHGTTSQKTAFFKEFLFWIYDSCNVNKVIPGRMTS